MDTEKTIVTINGVKMEIDLRQATIVHENLRVGSKVRLLEKGGTYSGPEVYSGVIVGFEPFETLPTIIVAYVKADYSTSELKFAFVNSKSADKWDLVPTLDEDMPIKKEDVIASFNRQIEKNQAAIQEIEAKKAYFLKYFNQYFVPVKEPAF